MGAQGAEALIERGRALRAGAPIQTKFTVGPAGDHYERVAFAVAGLVMRLLATPSPLPPGARREPRAPHAQAAPSQDAPTTAARSVTPAAAHVTPLPRAPLLEPEQTEEEIVQTAPADGPTVQRAVGREGGAVDGRVDADIRQARGGGHPLDGKVRGSMEQAFGANFGGVRVHTNPRADSLNRSLSAQAFTTGQDLFFRKGAYKPGSSSGQKLIAHELTHVVQQNGAAVKRQPQDAAETEPVEQDRTRQLDAPGGNAGGDGAHAGTPHGLAARVQRKPIKVVGRAPGQAPIQRQLSFDDSWEPSSFGFFSSYDKGKAQGELNAPFIEMELLFNELKSKPEPFVEQSDTERFTAIETLIMQLKARPVSWSERDKVRGDITTRLAWARELQTAPRKKPEPKTPKFLPGMFGLGKMPMPIMTPQTPVTPFAMVGVMAIYMRLHPEQFGLDPVTFQPISSQDGPPSGGKTEQEESLPPDVQKISGVTTLSMPGPPAQPVLSAELRNPVFSLEGESSVDVSAVRLNLDPLNTIEVPLALALKYSKASGFAGSGELTKPVKLNRFLTINKLNGEYRQRKLAVAGQAQVSLPGVESFESNVTYNEEDGLVVRANRVELRLPQINGVDSHGVLSELQYSTKTGAFDGRGAFDAEFPVLGLGEATVVVHQNKLQKVDLAFAKIAYPAVNPAIVGNAKGAVDFDEFGKFARGVFTTDLEIQLPDAAGEAQTGKLSAGASLEDGKFYAFLKLDKSVYINQYLTLQAVDLKVKDGELQGGGEFKSTSLLGSKTLPFASGTERALGEPAPETVDRKGKELKPDIQFGFEWDRGFWARGQISVPISPWDDKMLTGIVGYNKGKLSGSVEVGDAVLAPRIPFVKSLYSLEKSVLLTGIGKRGGDGKAGLGGIYAAIALDLNFYYNFGPLSVDAHATLSEIDLTAMTAELDPLHIEEVRGGLAAELKGRPAVGLGAYALSDRLLNVQGGVEMPLAALFKAEVVSHLSPMTYKEGKFTGPGLELELPLIFGLSGKLQPFINIYALGGLIDMNPPLEPIVSFEFLKARQLTAGKTDLNQLRVVTPESLQKNTPENLEAAPEAPGDEPTVATGASILEVRPKPPPPVKDKPGKGGLPTSPINFQSLLAKISTGLPLERLEKLVESLKKLADKFGITGGINKVLEWLDSYGLLEPLRKVPAMVDKLMEYVALGVDLTLDKLWELLEVNPEEIKKQLGLDEESGGPIRSYGDVRGDSVVLFLGQSRIWVDVEVTPGTHTGTIKKNRLEKNGIELIGVGKRPSLTFDSGKKLTGGKLNANLTIGEFGTVENVELAVDAEKNIAQKFVNGNFTPNEAKLPGLHDRVVKGEFGNTQVYLNQVMLDDKAPAPEMKNPVPGDSDAVAAVNEIDLTFQKLDKEWVLMGQGIKYKGLAVKVVLLKYSKNDKGAVSAQGMVTLSLDKIGRAKAKVEMVDNEFKSLDFIVESNTITLPGAAAKAKSEGSDEGDQSSEPSGEKAPGGAMPQVSGYFHGGFSVQNQKLRDMKLGANFNFVHGSLNEGKPVAMEGAVELDASWKPRVKLHLKTTPVLLMRGWGNVSKLTIDYDHRQRKLEIDGKAHITPGGSTKDAEPQEAPKTGAPKTEAPTKESGGAPPSEPGAIDGALTYKEGLAKLDLKTSNVGMQYMDLDQITVAYEGSKGWDLRAKATIKNIQGFEKIQATVYGGKGKLGFRFDKADKAEVKQPPGVGLTAALSALEYNLTNKKFTGEGNMGVAFPVGGTSVSATGFFRIVENRLTDYGVQLATLVKLPTAKPMFQGVVKGAANVRDGKLTGELLGDLTVIKYGGEEGGQSSEGAKSSGKEGGDKGASAGALKFRVTLDDTGVSGGVTQAGVLDLGGGLLVVKDVRMEMNRVPNVKETVAKLNTQGGDLAALGKGMDGSSIVRKSDFAGGGKLVADMGGVGRGALDLNYADGEFKKSYGHISLGPDPDKNAKPGLAGEVSSSYSTKEGFALEGGSLTANITPGLQAKGTLEKQKGGALENGLMAALDIKATFLKDKTFKKTLYSAQTRPTIPVLPGIFSLYGEAGVDLLLEYGVSPIVVTGKAQLNNVSLKNRTFESAIVQIQKAKSEKGGKQSGNIHAKFLGKPYLGLGAAVLHPGIVGVSGGMEMPVAAEAAIDPALDTRLVYDKQGKLKGRFLLDMPLALGVKVGINPYIKGTALAGLIDLTWRPEKALAEWDLMKPRTVYNLSLDFGNLKDADKDPEEDAPTSETQTKPASEKLAAEQQVTGDSPAPPAPVPTVEPKEGDADPTDDFSKSGPFDFAGIKGVIAGAYQKTVDTVKAAYKNVKEIAEKLGQLTAKAAEAVGGAVKSAASAVSTAITDVASWISAWYGGDTESALKEVEQSKSLKEVEDIEKFNWKKYRVEPRFLGLNGLLEESLRVSSNPGLLMGIDEMYGSDFPYDFGSRRGSRVQQDLEFEPPSFGSQWDEDEPQILPMGRSFGKFPSSGMSRPRGLKGRKKGYGGRTLGGRKQGGMGGMSSLGMSGFPSSKPMRPLGGRQFNQGLQIPSFSPHINEE